VRAIIHLASFWSNKMGNTTAFATAGYKTLWIAHWITTPRRRSRPAIGAAAGRSGGTSDGSVAGISGRVDLDRYKLAGFDPVLIK
jgi:GH25 family lysozyme M1 (1,4-beta-N-acetylmuramidase)